MEVEDEIEFADVAEVLVENFDKGLHQFQDDEFVLVLVDDGDEVKTGVALVHDLVLFIIQEIAHLGVPGDDQLVDLHPTTPTSRSTRCFYDCDKFDEYHFVSRERPCRLIRKKQWIIQIQLQHPLYNYAIWTHSRPPNITSSSKAARGGGSGDADLDYK